MFDPLHDFYRLYDYLKTHPLVTKPRHANNNVSPGNTTTNTTTNTMDEKTDESAGKSRFLDTVSKNVTRYRDSSPCYFYPETTEEIGILINESQLRTAIETAVLNKYPDMKELTVCMSYSRGYDSGYDSVLSIEPMSIYVTVSWENGVCPGFPWQVIEDTIKDHFHKLDIDSLYYSFQLDTQRLYSDDVILDTARKYADCICKDLPLNIQNVRMFRLGQASLYELAISELEMKEIVYSGACEIFLDMYHTHKTDSCRLEELAELKKLIVIVVERRGREKPHALADRYHTF